VYVSIKVAFEKHSLKKSYLFNHSISF